MIITNIDWNATTEDIQECNLPDEVEMSDEIEDDEIADWLSDNYDFCVNGFVIVKPLSEISESKFILDEDMTDIVDSVQIESDDTNGSDICSLWQDKYLVSIEARGAVKIWWNPTTDNLNNDKGTYYTRWSEFPEDLKDLIRNTGTAENHWTLDPRVYVSENNWFEIFIWERNGNGDLKFITSDVVDVEGESAEELKEDCISFLENYLEEIAA